MVIHLGNFTQENFGIVVLQQKFLVLGLVLLFFADFSVMSLVGLTLLYYL